MDKVAYILVCWNNKSLLKECIDSINNQGYPHKDIYLIDNNSSDDSADFIAENYPDVKLHRSEKNNGFAKGNNILIRQALKDPEIGYIALINTDARIEENWTTKLVEVAKQRPQVATLQSLTVDYFDNALIDSHHIFIREDFQATQYAYKELVGDENYYTCQVQGVNAAAAIVTRAFIEAQPEKNLFDQSFFMYLEDVDVALRAEILGWKSYFVAGTRAFHMGSASSNKQSSSFSLFWTARNQMPLLMKNIPLSLLLREMPKFLNDKYHLIRHLHANYPKGTASTYTKGLVIGFFRSFLYIGKRIVLQSRRKITTKRLLSIIRQKGFVN